MFFWEPQHGALGEKTLTPEFPTLGRPPAAGNQPGCRVIEQLAAKQGWDGQMDNGATWFFRLAMMAQALQWGSESHQR